MRAAVTSAAETIELIDRPEPAAPGPGEVVLRTEAVGICGSDLHYYTGDIGFDPASLYPRVQGHEISAVVDAVGPGCKETLSPGVRVALWPVVACGDCYPCSVDRPNACSRISIVGIHSDGALQERFVVPAANAFPAGDLPPEVTAFIEPTSIAVRSVNRGLVGPADKVVVLGAGPIGLAIALCALDRGASVLVLDRLESRLAHARSLGADTASVAGLSEIPDASRNWAGGEGPPIVFEATGVPEAVGAAIETVAPTGRVIVVGLSGRETPILVGALPFRELDVIGVSCCNAQEFADAVELVTRRQDVVAALITHRFTLEETGVALRFSLENPADVLKAVVRVS